MCLIVNRKARVRTTPFWAYKLLEPPTWAYPNGVRSPNGRLVWTPGRRMSARVSLGSGMTPRDWRSWNTSAKGRPEINGGALHLYLTLQKAQKTQKRSQLIARVRVCPEDVIAYGRSNCYMAKAPDSVCVRSCAWPETKNTWSTKKKAWVTYRVKVPKSPSL